MGTEFLLGMIKKFLEMDSGDGCMTMSMDVMPLNWTFTKGENSKFYVVYIIPQLKSTNRGT